MSDDDKASGERRVTATRDDLDRAIDALRCEIKTLIEGYHLLYNERHRAEGEKAKNLAEALKEYKTDANEWRSTLSDFRNSVPTLRDFQAMQDKIGELREARSGETAKDSAHETNKKALQWGLGFALTILLFVVAQAILQWNRQ